MGHLITEIDLIETYWNVNLYKSGKWELLNHDLIETYWNVNSNPAAAAVSSKLRFNRNILECKFVRNHTIYFRNNRFNRNILECKYY